MWHICWEKRAIVVPDWLSKMLPSGLVAVLVLLLSEEESEHCLYVCLHDWLSCIFQLGHLQNIDRKYQWNVFFYKNGSSI